MPSLGKPRLVFEKHFFDSPIQKTWDVAPDGRFVMIERGESEPRPTQLIVVQNWTEELKGLVPTN